MIVFSALKSQKLSQGAPGYSLIEMALVLTILGIVGSLSLPLFTQHLRHKRQEETLKRHENILRSLAAYVMREGRLPYAANPGAPSPSFGTEETDRQKVSGRGIGLVPFKTLEIDESMVKDPYGHYISYGVDTHLCKQFQGINKPIDAIPAPVQGPPPRGPGPGSFQPSPPMHFTQPNTYFCSVGKGPAGNVTPTASFQIQTPSGLQDNRAIILISHGQGGYGAFKGRGALAQNEEGSAGPQERHNAMALKTGTRVYEKAPYSTASQTLFRHCLTSVTRDALLALYTPYPCRHKS